MPSIISLAIDSHVAHIQLTSPATKNKISVEFLEQFKHIIRTVAKDKSVQAVCISSTGKHFSDGFDFNELNSIDSRNMQQQKKLIHGYQKLLYSMFTFAKPIVTVVNGIARAGGVGIIAASDYIIATENASFELGELLFGLIPAAVMPYLSRRISIQIIKRIILTTELLDSKAALQCGIVDKMIEQRQVLATIKLTCKHLLRLNSYGIKTLKYFAKEIGDGKAINKLTAKSGNILCHLLFRPQIINNIRAFSEYGTPPEWFTKYNPDQIVLEKIYG